MRVDRCYILLGNFNRRSRAGGSDFHDINLRDILGGIYDKYNRFNLKLESYITRVASSTTVVNDCMFLQVAGLNWLSGTDTNPLYPASRVAAVLAYDHVNTNFGDFYRGMVYPSNIATNTFSKQANPSVTLELFTTNPDNNIKTANLLEGELPVFLFSITGVEDKSPLYRMSDIPTNTSQLVLNPSKGTYLEVNRRAVRWSVDLSQVIDKSAYTKYSKFALITKLILSNNVFPLNSQAGYFPVMMSGLNWYSSSLKLNSTFTGQRTTFEYHNGPVNTVALATDFINTDFAKETFIDNVFYKPASPIVDLTITFNDAINFGLVGATAPIEPFCFLFQILPVD